MSTFTSVVVVIVLAVLAESACSTVAQSVQPRRDENWPPPDFLEELRPIRLACRAQNPTLTDESIRRFSDVEAHDDEPLKCYMSCLFHEFGMVDDAGEAHFEKILARLTDSMRPVAGRMLSECEHPLGETLCERAHWLHKCFKRVDPVHYFLV